MTVPEHNGKIPFPFGPFPRQVNRALRAREISRDEFVILVVLYGRVHRETWVTTTDLDKLAEDIAWEHSRDWLRKRLVRLRSQGWVSYETNPGSTTHDYAIKLLWARPEVSEQSLSSQALNHAGSEVPDYGDSLSTALPSLSTEEPSNPLPGSDSDPAPTAPRLSSKDDGENTNTGTKERLKVRGLGSLNYTTVEGEGSQEDELPWHALAARAVNREIGNEGYAAFARSAYRRGHLTHGELLGRLRVHGWLMRRSLPVDEHETVQAVTDTFDAMAVAA